MAKAEGAGGAARGTRGTRSSSKAELERLPYSIRDVADGGLVFERLKSSIKYDWRDYVALVALYEDGTPFAVLAAVILSQNTTDKNSVKAYLSLREKIGVDPKSIAEAPVERIAEAIKLAGLARQKAEALKGAAAKVLELGGEEALVKLDPETLKRELLQVRGVGPKTVDVFLSAYRRVGVFAVDTHARRIAVRWGLARPNASYDEVSRALLEFFGPERAEEAHRLLIALGRLYCKAKRPRCGECPLRDVCPYPRARQS
ncbi:endonuclease III domain-containing protein [Stetteria hydrogenophila]